MSDDNHTTRWHQQALLTAGFFGGVSFTALVLVLQAKGEFTPDAWGSGGIFYFGVLISLIGSTSALFIFAAVTMTGLAAGGPESTTVMSIRAGERKKATVTARDNFAVICFAIGFFGLILSVPLLLLPIDWVASVIVGIVEAILTIGFLKLPQS